MNPIVRELVLYALSKKGAELNNGGELTEDLQLPGVKLPGVSWGHFFEVADANSYGAEFRGMFAKFPVYAERLVEYQKTFMVIRQTDWAPRYGHIQMAVPLDADLPENFLKSLIDEAYVLIWNTLDSRAKLRIEWASGPFDEIELIDELIDLHQLHQRRAAIHSIIRRAVLLRTSPTSGVEAPLGASRIGGMPDLPPSVPWPVFNDGRPLAFLCQIDLASTAKFGTILEGLPAQGVLSVFSVWGWMREDSSDPQVPDRGREVQDGWTTMLYLAPGEVLERRTTPAALNSFRAAAVDPIPILSLPGGHDEPVLAALSWSEDEYERFDQMQHDFRSVQKGYWLKQMGSVTAFNCLGGYASFSQYYPEEVLLGNSTMLLQIGSDDHSWMMWGDGGELTLYADSEALLGGRFERLWGDVQGG